MSERGVEIRFSIVVSDDNGPIYSTRWYDNDVAAAIAALKKAIQHLEEQQLPSTAHFFPDDK